MSITQQFIIPVLESPDRPKIIMYSGNTSIHENANATNLGYFTVVDAIDQNPILGVRFEKVNPNVIIYIIYLYLSFTFKCSFLI